MMVMMMMIMIIMMMLMMMIMTLDEYDRGVLVRKVQIDYKQFLYFQTFFLRKGFFQV